MEVSIKINDGTVRLHDATDVREDLEDIMLIQLTNAPPCENDENSTAALITLDDLKSLGEIGDVLVRHRERVAVSLGLRAKEVKS